MNAYSILAPILRLVPEVPKPLRRLSLRERLFWTGVVLLTYMAMSQIPLYGIEWSAQGYERLLLFQVIMASRRGTLMELGIGPLVTAGIIWQLLVGSRIIELDLSTREGRRVFAGVQKLLAFAFAVFEALAYILGGVYGPLPPVSQALIFIQLMVASTIVILMDDMLEKGWGVGSAVSLFIAAGVAQQVFWELFSPIGPMADGLFVGVVPSLLHATFTYVSSGNSTPLIEVVARRSGYPDILGLASMVGFLLLLVYLESMRIEIPVTSMRYGGIRARVPLKFLYVSNLPVILVSALYANMYMVAQAVWSRFNPDNSNAWINVFAMFNATSGRPVPMKPSLIYYLSPPRSIWAVYSDPVHVAVYAAVFIALSILFALVWVAAAGMDPASQAEQLVKAELQVPGFRSSTRILEAMLRTYIWPLTVVSGAVVGTIAVVSDLLGTLGSGIGILLTVGILVQYQQILAREQLIEMHPVLSKLLSVE
ncbi:MAG: preprotein translocase subunit SecY [Thermoprotei archaeon]|nr:MAG: preprotein translocase subunit SecY [Thermoprotei archaeon]